MRCKHLNCNGNILSDGKCLQCGRPAKKEFVYTKRSVEQAFTVREYKPINRGHRGTCENCTRPDLWLTNKLCGACHSQIYINRYGVKYKFDKNSAEGKRRLLIYRERKWPEKFRGGEILIKQCG